ncbi:hypothetical protein WJX72_007214 [[Myrmecia] bisecta]|uniref:Uncharacterized protein n=1 Tax=[Myrmecia] bisecta TaxID=41462 RepID=A0AAW1Q870_9CHLO
MFKCYIPPLLAQAEVYRILPYAETSGAPFPKGLLRTDMRRLVMSSVSNLGPFPDLMDDLLFLKVLEIEGSDVLRGEVPEDEERRLVLPDSFCDMQCLDKGNPLRDLPDAPYLTRCLEDLDLSSGEFREFPKALGLMSQLCNLNLSKCEELVLYEEDECADFNLDE